MKTLIQFQHPDGSWPSVGMNYQWLETDCKTLDGVVRKTQRICAKYHPAKKGKPYRVVDFTTDKVLYEGRILE